MSYTPNTWQTGDTITATKLNNMEQGIASAGGVFIVGITDDGTVQTLTQTWQQIYDAVDSGSFVVIQFRNSDGIHINAWVSDVETDGSWYSVMVYFFGSQNYQEFGTNSPSGYPSYS